MENKFELWKKNLSFMRKIVNKRVKMMIGNENKKKIILKKKWKKINKTLTKVRNGLAGNACGNDA